MKCKRCDGRGYEKLPPGVYGMIQCSSCRGTGKDPVFSIREAFKKAAEKLKEKQNDSN